MQEIKLRSLRCTKSAEDAADELEMANAVIATAKKNLITQVVKRNVMENVIPLVLSLKHMVSGRCWLSPHVFFFTFV